MKNKINYYEFDRFLLRIKSFCVTPQEKMKIRYNKPISREPNSNDIMHKCPACGFEYLSQLNVGYNTSKENNFGRIFICPNAECDSQKKNYSWVEFDLEGKAYLGIIGDFDLTLMLQEFSGWVVEPQKTIDFVSVFKILETKTPEEKAILFEKLRNMKFNDLTEE